MSNQSIFKIIPQLGHGTFSVIASAILEEKNEYLLVSLDDNGTLIVWDILTGKQLFEYNFPDEKPTQLHLTLDNLFACGGPVVYRWKRKNIPEVKTKPEKEIRQQIGPINSPAQGSLSFQASQNGRLSRFGDHYTYLEYPSGQDRFTQSVSVSSVEEGSFGFLGRISNAQLDEEAPQDVFIHSHIFNSEFGFLAVIYDHCTVEWSSSPFSAVPRDITRRYLAIVEFSDNTFEVKTRVGLPIAGPFWLSQSGEYAIWADGFRLQQLDIVRREADEVGFALDSDPHQQEIGNLAEELDEKEIEAVVSIRDAILDKQGAEPGPRHCYAAILNMRGKRRLRIFQRERGAFVFDQELKEKEQVLPVLAFSIQYKYFTTGPVSTGPIRLWNIERDGGALEREFFAGRPEIVKVFKQDNDELNLVFRNNTIYTLSFRHGISLKKKWEAPGKWKQVAISRQGDQIAWVEESTPRQVALLQKDGPPSSLFPDLLPAEANGITFSPDGSLLAVWSGEEIALFDTEGPQEKARWPLPSVRHLAFQPESTRMAVVYTDTSGNDHATLFDWGGTPEGTSARLWNFCFSDKSLNEEDSQQGMKFAIQPAHSGYTVEIRQGEAPLMPETAPAQLAPANGPATAPYPRFSRDGHHLLLQSANRLEILDLESCTARPDSKPPVSALAAQRIPSSFIEQGERTLLPGPDGQQLEAWKPEHLVRFLTEYQSIRNKLKEDEKPIRFSPPFEDGFMISLDSLSLLLFPRKHEECLKLYKTNEPDASFIGTLFPVNEKKFLLVDEAGNYYTSSEGYDLIAFLHEAEIYPIGQFDLLFNRPHILLGKLGLPEELIASYEKAYRKRLNKTLSEKLDEEELSEEQLALPFEVEQLISGDIKLQLPSVEIRDKYAIPGAVRYPGPEADGQTEEFGSNGLTYPRALQIELNISSSRKLKRLNLFINNVPVEGRLIWGGKEKKEWPLHGRKGFHFGMLEGEGAQISEGLSLSVEFELSTGLNKIEVSVLNELGVEGLRDSLYINYSAAVETLPTLYFIGLGVGVYDHMENLFESLTNVKKLSNGYRAGLAAKDGIRRLFGKFEPLLLFNARVQENWNEIRPFLEKTTVDDRVVVFYSGHGIRDKDTHEFFLGTTAVERLKPAEAGIRYAALESLVDGIPARNKLVMIDACFSGEWDEDPQHFELMKTLFVDLRRGTGATIIASASALQEAEAGGNLGDFTAFGKCLLTGLGFELDTESKGPLPANLNEDGKVSISELQDYLAVALPKLSEGRHHLASRMENIVNDWFLR